LFKFKTNQKIFQIGNVKIGGQPGELPKVLIGSLFYQNQKLVKDPKKGVFDKEAAKKLIEKQDELSRLTGNPCLIDVVCTSVESAHKYIDFVSEVTDTPISIDIWNPEIKIKVLNYIAEVGLENRILYNSIYFPKADEIEAIKESKIKSALLLAYNIKDRAPRGVLSLLKDSKDQKGLLTIAEEAGIEKLLIDTTLFTYIPSIGAGAKACYMVKEELGLPAGGSPGNATTVWKKSKKFGEDVLLYGVIESAPWIFPACAAVDAMIAADARVEFGTKTLTKNHPLNRLFPEFIEQLEKANF
jgi:tetrahydromethanopterin S-methyltransferase subunit H